MTMCVDCGATLRFARSKRCRPCYMKWHVAKDGRPTCVDCGAKITWAHQRCQPCYFAAQRVRLAKPPGTCERCGKPPINRHSRVCLECVQAQAAERQIAQVCVDCGRPKSTNKTTRCLECYRAHEREEAAKRLCARPNCTHKAKSQGLCANHYRNCMVRERKKAWGPKLQIQATPCGVCGYDRMRSHAHRLVSALGYVEGNMVPLCARCHEEVHRGLAAPPDPAVYTTSQSTTAP